jgi:triacylglycerol lipase
MVIPKLGSPVVLVHGLLGFGLIRVAGWRVASYFRGVPEVLERAGNRVLVPSLSLTAGITDRARQLKEFLDREVPHDPVHLVAHSMGGLDARYLISRLGMAGRVLSLTTLGTPHRGTHFADWGLRRLARFLRPVFEFGNVPYQAFYDLTAAHAEEFNASAPDSPRVRYFSVAGRIERAVRHPQWAVAARILEKSEGPNDGIVSVASAKYGESFEEWQADHLDLVNWPYPLATGVKADRVAGYAGLVRRLADEGF